MAIADYTSTIRGKLIIDAYKKWLRSNKKVLDIGCGTGVVSKQLAKHFKIKVVGCDVDNLLTVKIKFVKMTSIDKLPFKNISFDIVMFNDVLHHTTYANQIKLLQEAMRVSKKVLIFEAKPTLAGKLSDYLINKIHYKNLDVPFNFRKVSNWKNLFRKMNLKFEVKKVKRPLLYPFTNVAFRVEKN